MCDQPRPHPMAEQDQPAHDPAAGLFIVAEELMRDTARAGDSDVATVGFVVGFAVMMAPDNLAG